jgi:hypothetical protein
VVDNGNGGTYDYFNICISLSENEKPSCNYTATLIDRNQEKDIALLKINPTDIYGVKVDIAELASIEIDYDYIPKS